MAFGGENIYSGGSFSSNCIDDIPFQLGPRFRPPNRVILPAGLELPSPSRSMVLNEEYSFEVEEAVLKWSAEKQKQDQIIRERTLKRRTANAAKTSDNSDSPEPSEQPTYENVNTSSGEIPNYENMATMLMPQPVPKPRTTKPKTEYANVPNPLIANISNDILTPTPSVKPGENGVVQRQNSKPDTKPNDINLSWFEKVDDPFDNLELQTINDMEELANVLKETNNATATSASFGNITSTATTTANPVNTASTNTANDAPVKPGCNVAVGVETSPSHDYDNHVTRDQVATDDGFEEENVDDDDDEDEPFYENVELKMVGLKIGGNKTMPENSDQTEVKTPFDINSLPPVPPRRALVGLGAPLPPIGSNGGGGSKRKSQNLSPVSSTDQLVSRDNDTPEQNNSDRVEEVIQPSAKSKVPPKPAVPKPPRTFRYSRHDLDESENADTTTTSCNNVQPSVSINNSQNNVQFTNSQGSNASNSASDETSNLTKTRDSNSDLKFVANHFDLDGMAASGLGRPRPVPPPKPTSPPTRPSSNQTWNRYSPLPDTSISPPMKVALPGLVKTDTTSTAYSRLDPQARSAVDNVVSMGFVKDRVIRAVEKQGADEKEVVEYLCQVEQLMDRGYNTQLAETALLLFQNSMNKASSYLELFTQLLELGFNGEKIQEALVNTDNDREKTLDILTASS